MISVLVNLITNAIKFTAKKKGDRKITVSMGASTERPTSYPPNLIYFSQDQEAFHFDSTTSSEWGGGDSLYLMVAVKDSGIGISQEGQAKLFERFRSVSVKIPACTSADTSLRQATPKTQENYGGSGLGLFISRKCTWSDCTKWSLLIVTPSVPTPWRRHWRQFQGRRRVYFWVLL